MNRREFIKTAGLATGTILLSGVDGIAQLTNKPKKMKIVVLTSSPRKNGNTNHLAEQFIKGATEVGHDIFRFNCAEKEVHSCIACDRCGNDDGQCVFHDDFYELRPHLKEADVVVFVTPMYYFGVSSQLKQVIDRFYSINGALQRSPKKAVFLMAYADTDPVEAEPMISHYHTLLRYLKWKDAGMVIAPGMWPVGAVNGSKYAQQAYELGKTI